ncbi:MAG: DUF3006 domain-containing protein [Oscillospiraceae bacterium]|nr:DUF3006 domain-containing protein [Oscillospiraceae bacterium]
MLIVDRIEGEYAVCEGDNGKIQNILLCQLPTCVNEGSVLKLIDGKYVLDENAYLERRQRILDLQKKLFKK